jgi:hypothetical protein
MGLLKYLFLVLLLPLWLLGNPMLPPELKAGNAQISQLHFDGDPSYSHLLDPKKITIKKQHANWYTFSLKNPASKAAKKFLLFDKLFFNTLELYVINDRSGEVTYTKSSPAVPRAYRYLF